MGPLNKNNHRHKNDIPSLLTRLLTFATSSKFDHVFASRTLATIRRLAHLKIKQILKI